MKCCDNYKYNPSYTYASCGNCGAITLDSGREWGVAKNMTFKSMSHAEFYIKNGKRSDNDLKEEVPKDE